LALPPYSKTIFGTVLDAKQIAFVATSLTRQNIDRHVLFESPGEVEQSRKMIGGVAPAADADLSQMAGFEPGDKHSAADGENQKAGNGDREG
jgi:hypothetical protein